MATALKLAHHAAYLGDSIFVNGVHADRAVTFVSLFFASALMRVNLTLHHFVELHWEHAH